MEVFDIVALYKGMVEGIFSFLADFTSFLTGYMPIEAAIILIGLLYVVINFYASGFFRKELMKRKEILHDVNLYKVTHPIKEKNDSIEEEGKDEEEDSPKEEVVKMLLNYKQDDREPAYYKGLTDVVERRSPKPYKAMFLMAIQTIIFISLMAFFLQAEDIGHSHVYYLVLIGLLVIGQIGKKINRFKLGMLSMMVFLYSKFTAAMLLLLITLSASRTVKGFVASYKSKKRNQQ